MRTTVDIPEPLLQNAKQRASELGTTVSGVIQDALRAHLSRSVSERSNSEFRLHTVRGKLVDPGLDLDRTSALLARDDEAKFGSSSR